MKAIRPRGMRIASGELGRAVIARLAARPRMLSRRPPLVFVRRHAAEAAPAHRSFTIVNAPHHVAVHLALSWRVSPAGPHAPQMAGGVSAVQPARSVSRRRSPVPALRAHHRGVADTLVTRVRERSETVHTEITMPPRSPVPSRADGRVVPASRARLHPVQLPLPVARWRAAAVVAPASPTTRSAFPVTPRARLLRAAAPAAAARLVASRAMRRPTPAAAPALDSASVRRIAHRHSRTAPIQEAPMPVRLPPSPVSRVLRAEAIDRVGPAPPAAAERPMPAMPKAAAARPVIDVERLSDEVYRHIQRRVRIERERRGA